MGLEDREKGGMKIMAESPLKLTRFIIVSKGRFVWKFVIVQDAVSVFLLEILKLGMGLFLRKKFTAIPARADWDCIEKAGNGQGPKEC